MTFSAQPATEAAIWLAFAPAYGHFTAVAIGPHHLLTVASLSEHASYIKIMRAGEQVRTAEVERVCAPEEGDLAVLRVDDELTHTLPLVPLDECDAILESEVELVGYRNALNSALERRAIVLHSTNAKILPDDEGVAPQLTQPLAENEAGAPILDERQRIAGIAFQGEDLETCLVFPVKRFYELNEKWRIAIRRTERREPKSPTTAQSLALMHLVTAQHDEQRDGSPAERLEHYRSALRLDPQCGAAHLGIARDKSLLGELDDEVFHSLGRACELLSASEWSPQCRDRGLTNLLCSSKHLHGIVTAVRADLKRNLPLAGWAALGRAIDDLVQFHYGPQGIHFAGGEHEEPENDTPRLPEKAAGRVLLWTGQPRSVIAIPSKDQPDILRAAAFLLVDHAEQALFWLDDPTDGDGGEGGNRLEMTQQFVAALRYIARCRERMFDAPLSRDVAEKYAAVVGKLMPGGDVLSWHANALAKAAHGDIEGAVEDLDRAIRGLSPIALPGRWSREFPGLLPTPAQLACSFGEVVLAQDKPDLARRALARLPMPATDDAHVDSFARIEETLRERCGIEPDVEISADRALVRANREHPLAVRLARTFAYFAIAPLPCTRLGDLAVALPYLKKLGVLQEMAGKPWYEPIFRSRVQELTTTDQRNTAIHDALEIILAHYTESTAADRAELLPHIREVTRFATEHEVDLSAVTDLLARAGNQRARELAYSDAKDLLERAAETADRADASPHLRAEIDMDLGWVEFASGEFVAARERLLRALRHYDDLAATNDRLPYRRMARINYTLAKVALGQNDTETARAHAAKSLEQAERGFDPGSRKAVQMFTSLTHMFIQLGDQTRVFKANSRLPSRESSLTFDA